MRFLDRLVISLTVSLVGHLGLKHSPDWIFLVLSSKLNVFGQLCNFIFEPRNLSLRLSEMFLHLIHWFAHNFPQPCCCLGTSTMVLGSLAKTFLEWCGFSNPYRPKRVFLPRTSQSPMLLW